MSIITISRASCSIGELIAKDVASALGYACIGDSEVICAASAEFSIAGQKLKDAVENPPSFFGLSFNKRAKYLLCFQASLIHFLLQDDVVYYGPAGNFLIQGVSHMLTVYIQADLDDRVRVKTTRDNIPPGEAMKYLLNDDDAHQKWARFIYKNDYNDRELYDLYIIREKDRPEQAIQTIISEVKKRRYHTTTYSVSCLKKLALSCRVKAALVDIDPEIAIRTDGATVFVHTRACGRDKEKRAVDVKKIAQTVTGVESVEVDVTEDLFLQMANSCR
ncbi:MAG: cytidylate kinase-like family protein [Nitrospirae bacterium]|nr:cytidylate kinase-like family protein [Nitrospirota bacterium]